MENVVRGSKSAQIGYGSNQTEPEHLKKPGTLSGYIEGVGDFEFDRENAFTLFKQFALVGLPVSYQSSSNSNDNPVPECSTANYPVTVDDLSPYEIKLGINIWQNLLDPEYIQQLNERYAGLNLDTKLDENTLATLSNESDQILNDAHHQMNNIPSDATKDLYSEIEQIKAQSSLKMLKVCLDAAQTLDDATKLYILGHHYKLTFGEVLERQELQDFLRIVGTQDDVINMDFMRTDESSGQ